MIYFIFSLYLTALRTECRYTQDGIKCTGIPVLKCLRRHDKSTPPSYFIGCSGWKINEKYHRYISVKENINLRLLNQLLNGTFQVKYKLLIYFFYLSTKV